MKRLNLLIVLGILFAGGVYVFSHGMRDSYYGNRYRGFHMGGGYGYCYEDAYLEKELNLTKEQEAKIEKINKEYWAKYDKNRGNRTVMWKLHEEHDNAITKVLTPEQRKNFEKFNAPGRFQGYHGRRGYARGRGCW